MRERFNKLPELELIEKLIFSNPAPVKTVAQLIRREAILDAWRQACIDCDRINVVSIWIAELAPSIGEIEISNAIEIVRKKFGIKDTETTIEEIREAMRTFIDPISV